MVMWERATLLHLWGQGFQTVRTNADTYAIGDYLNVMEDDGGPLVSLQPGNNPDHMRLVKIRPDGYLDTGETWATVYREVNSND